ncbi:MAG TPA: Fur family transcriptional regulator [Nitrospiraceae bacterium]|nr:Fur family transcriptional regulator [Nitrospiraceae bacterium]
MNLTLDEIRRRFRACGVRLTPQRVAIYQALTGTAAHPTAEALYRQVKRQHPMLSQNTVYYTLGTLKAAGLVHEVNYWHDRARFDANMALHHHLICLGCRRIDDLTDDGLDNLVISARRASGFHVLGHRVEFHGHCAECRYRTLTVNRESLHGKNKRSKKRPQGNSVHRE